MFSFNRKCRESLASQIILLANGGAAGLTLILGSKTIEDNAMLAFLVIGLWWLALQLLAHFILAFEEDEEANGQHTRRSG